MTFAGAGVAAIVVAIVASPDLRAFIQVLGERFLEVFGIG